MIFFTDFSNQIRRVCSTQKQSDIVFNLCETLVQEQMVLCENLLREKFNEHDIEDIKSTIDVCSEYESEKLQEHQTQLKRLKKLQMNPLYVGPETKSIGLK